MQQAAAAFGEHDFLANKGGHTQGTLAMDRPAARDRSGTWVTE